MATTSAQNVNEAPKALSKRGRKRRFTERQHEILEAFYAKQKFVNFREKKKLEEDTDLSVEQIEKWFENRRVTDRKRGIRIEEKTLRIAEKSSNPGESVKLLRLGVSGNVEEEPKRKRRKFNGAETEILVKAFEKNAFPEIEERKKLAEILGISLKQVHRWFQNHRGKTKIEERKEDVDKEET
ncbi:hypothetical protein L596_009116 [Steinernema carpocapsae]|uniref:Homeobox domain-containing protein n=1 Tax=Steinernema carpocapsae TaxID=34508 RepID=A0A4U5PFM1_STECR|nr:hypothetical protein L596_009116 [Steinernema carpocapsae]